MSFIHTFIQVAADCPVSEGMIPVGRNGNKPIHVIQYELLSQNPYQFTHEELIYAVHLIHKNISTEERDMHGERIRRDLFQKKHPCMRASLLPKKYGWGIHFDGQGKMALYGMETKDYQQFVQSAGDRIKVLAAMRNSRG
ncbi:DUF6157 family protein [Brevibacillus migulae]|uniref:DUF6157 family protein n=1 Tax=Brevibacillus migulae TaxID=1644114 RepID=UPI00106E33F9|nr:DUF6157 family protein [Brevibacillus migulae]